ncbi:MAG TPA: terminase, partial [Ottowia sp.]|nr:terminase [Ottowia sp.]
GMFPSMSSRQFISEADVTAAYGKSLQPGQYQFAPVILTVDPAWEGDDELVVGKRQGLAFSILHRMPKNDNDLVVAQIVARLEREHDASAVFVDAGFGTGIVSAGQGLGLSWTLVWFAGASGDPGCLNKRAEMWKAMRDWLKAGGAIPDDPQLRDELQAPEIVPRIDGKLQLEAKKDMKARGVPSPNRADALALSFAFPVAQRSLAARAAAELGLATRQQGFDYDPYA